jgi:hypothetical protein
MLSALLSQFALTCSAPTFLGLRPWYYYLNYGAITVKSPNGTVLSQYCGIQNFQLLPAGSTPSDVPLVLLAVVDDLLRIGGLVAVGFIIYGAIQYVTSQGSPDQTSHAQRTIINAVVGLVISIIAVTVVSFIGNTF